MNQYYKVARTDGFDFYTGNTINYRDNIGKTVTNPKKTESKELCSDNVLHASKLFIDALGYGELPCSVFIVEGTPVSEQDDKTGFKKLKVVREIGTENWKSAFYKFMIWMLKDLKNNFDVKKEKDVTKAINQVIKVFTNAQKTGKIDESAARAAAESAAESADSAAMYAARAAANSAVWSAARYAADSAVWSAVEPAAESAADSAVCAAVWAAEAAKKQQLSEKFVEFLEETE